MTHAGALPQLQLCCDMVDMFGVPVDLIPSCGRDGVPKQIPQSLTAALLSGPANIVTGATILVLKTTQFLEAHNKCSAAAVRQQVSELFQ